MPKCYFLIVPTSHELLLRKILRTPSLCAFGSSWCSQHLDSVTWTPALLRGHSSLPPRMMVVGILFFPSKKNTGLCWSFLGLGWISSCTLAACDFILGIALAHSSHRLQVSLVLNLCKNVCCGFNCLVNPTGGCCNSCPDKIQKRNLMPFSEHAHGMWLAWALLVHWSHCGIYGC